MTRFGLTDMDGATSFPFAMTSAHAAYRGSQLWVACQTSVANGSTGAIRQYVGDGEHRSSTQYGTSVHQYGLPVFSFECIRDYDAVKGWIAI